MKGSIRSTFAEFLLTEKGADTKGYEDQTIGVNSEGNITLYDDNGDAGSHIGSMAYFISFIQGRKDYTHRIKSILAKAIKEAKSTEQKTEIINTFFYILNVINTYDHQRMTKEFLTDYASFIDTDAIFYPGKNYTPTLEKFSLYDNNIVKCLIFNEKWQSLFELFSSKVAKPNIVHKDNKGKTDLTALIINQAPWIIINDYLKFAEPILEKIDFFEKQDGYSLVEYMFIFGQSQLLEKFKDQINAQRQDNISADLQIYNLHKQTNEQLIALANKILNANGGDCIVKKMGLNSNLPDNMKHNIKKPTDRKFGLDWALWSAICETIKTNETSKDKPFSRLFDNFLIPSIAQIKQSGYDDQQLKKKYASIPEFLLERRLNPAADGNDSPVRFYPKNMHNKSRGDVCLSGFGACKKLLHSIFADAIQLVKKSDIAELSKLLDENPGLAKLTDNHGISLLHICTNSYNITKQAFKGEADADIKAKEALTQRLDVWQLLCDHGADPEARNQVTTHNADGERAQDILQRLSKKTLGKNPSEQDIALFEINKSFADNILSHTEFASKTQTIGK